MILIIGAQGSMGERYQSILQFLGKDYRGTDVRHTESQVLAAAEKSSGVIIATPTDTHAQYIRLLAPFKKPILCEKPLTKNVEELKDLMLDLRRYQTPFRMMFQYSLLAEPSRIGKSFYNYFRHGKDGLIWDCLQIIALARSEVTLSEESPIWRCMINDKALRSDHMDAAYVGYVQKWFTHPNQDLGELLAIHERVKASENVYGSERRSKNDVRVH